MTDSPLEIIAEIGVNHDGSVERALEMMETARDCGADTVKFQLFRPEDLATSGAPLARYQERSAAGSQVDMLRALALEPAEMGALRSASREMGLRFLCSPFDFGSLRFLVEDLKVDTVKIASGELTNGPLLWEAARSGARILLSTGMADMDEIEEALGVLVLGRAGGVPDGRGALRDAWRLRARELTGVTLLHCTTEYPCPDSDANVRAIPGLRERFGLPVGFSDHTAGWEIALAAVALGATVVEKHFTMDRTAPGPDHAASIEPADFTAMVRAIRRVETALGSGRKVPQPSESKNRAIARKSLVTATEIAAGEKFSVENLTAKRPGTGRSPLDYWGLLGQPAERAYAADEKVD